MRSNESYAELLAPRKRELLAPVRIWDKGVILSGAWMMCTRDYTLVFQDLELDESLCEIMAKSGKKMYRSIFASRLFDLERILAGLLSVVRLENFGLVSSGWFFWGMNILHSSSFDELFKYLLSGREVFVSRLSSSGQSSLVLGKKPKFLPAWFWGSAPYSDQTERPLLESVEEFPADIYGAGFVWPKRKGIRAYRMVNQVVCHQTFRLSTCRFTTSALGLISKLMEQVSFEPSKGEFELTEWAIMLCAIHSGCQLAGSPLRLLVWFQKS